MQRIAWGTAAALVAVGVVLMVFSYEPRNAFALAITALIVGSMIASVMIVCSRLRTLDDEYQAGYRMGYRSGRKDGLTPSVSPIRRARRGLGAFNRDFRRGQLSRADDQLERREWGGTA